MSLYLYDAWQQGIVDFKAHFTIKARAVLRCLLFRERRRAFVPGSSLMSLGSKMFTINMDGILKSHSFCFWIVQPAEAK